MSTRITAAAVLFLVLAGVGLAAMQQQSRPATGATSKPAPATLDPREKHLKNLRQVTFGGENAEAYWSFGGNRLILQSTHGQYACDQIFTVTIGADGTPGELKLVSTGTGRTTCSYFMKGDSRILYASTHLGDKSCPTPPDRSQGYVWGLFPHFDIFTAKPDGTDIVRLTDHPRYDAEATVDPVSGDLVFTSLREGDLDLYSMDAQGKNVRRLTDKLGYDGGAFFSSDGKRIVWRAMHPETEAEIADYKRLLEKDLVRPSKLDIWVMDRDGSNKKRVTRFDKASFAPFFMPDNRRIIFASNMDDPKGRNFDIYIVKDDGTGLERITFNDTFDGFPMFSPDGRWLAFSSNRGGRTQGETNVFIAEWVD